MVTDGAIVQRDGRLPAAADHTPVDQTTLQVPFPRAWSEPTASRCCGEEHDHG